jgi:hypothetical protein
MVAISGMLSRTNSLKVCYSTEAKATLEFIPGRWHFNPLSHLFWCGIAHIGPTTIVLSQGFNHVPY